MASRDLGTLINELFEIREERRELKTQDDILAKKFKNLKEQIIEELDRIGLDKASGDLASVSISEVEVPSVTDWTKLLRFIARNKAMHLFERRIAKGAWQELVESRNGRPLPGVDSWVKRDINLTTR